MGLKYDTEDGLRLYETGRGAVAKNEADEIKRVYTFGADFYGLKPQPLQNVDRIKYYRSLSDKDKRRAGYNGARCLQEYDTPGVDRFLAPYTPWGRPDDCDRCSHQYRSMQQQNKDVFAYAREVTNAEAESSIATLVKGITDDYGYLRGQVPEYGGALVARWKKKAKQQQRAMLLEALPGMYEKKWAVPNLDLREGIGVDWVSQEKDRYSWLLPYLNLETLLEDPVRLMALIHFRTIYSPADWVHYDNDQVDKPFMRGAVAIEFNSVSVGISGEAYGMLVDFDKEAAHRLRALGYPRAQLVLDAQRTLYAFLRKMVSTILHGAEGKGKAEKWEELVRTDFTGGQSTHFGELYLRDPYVAPPRFDPHRMLEIAQARLHAAEDELWLLQTDPAYVQYILDDRMTTELSRRGQDSMHNWHWIGDELITQAPRRVRIWETMIEEIAALAKAIAVASETSRESTDVAFEHFNGVLYWIQEVHNKALHQMLCETRLFQRHFLYEKMEDGDIDCIPNLDDDLRAFFVNSPLMWAAVNHAGSLKHDRVNPYDSRLINGFIDDTIRNSSIDVRKKVDNRFYSHITEMAAVHEIKYIASHFHPKPDKPGIDPKKLITMFSDRLFWRSGVIEANHAHGPCLKQNGVLLKAFYETKWPKGAKDDKWLKQATDCRNALNKLWKSVRQEHSRLLKHSQLTDAEKQREVERISACAKREHVVELLRERSAIAEMQQQRLQQRQGSTAHTPSFGEGTSNLQKEVTLRISKPKKRSDEAISGSSADDQRIEKNDLPEHLEDERRISVSRSSLRLFQQMYPSQVENTTKTVWKWQEVVTALTDAGLAVVPGDGSAVTFRRSKEDGGGAIVLHRPHPSPTVGPVMLQVFGKRLRKWFGWDRNMFVEQERL